MGLTRGTGRAHLARAALEAIAYQTVDAVRAQEDAAGASLEVLKADGGAVSNRWLMQFQADVLGSGGRGSRDRRDDRRRAPPTWPGSPPKYGIPPQVEAMWREKARYEPSMGSDERAALLGDWRRAVERARGWASA